MTELLPGGGLYFLLAFVLATLFAIVGAGSAIALVPTFSMLGLERMRPPGIAAATALLIGTMLTLVVLPVLFSLLDDVAHAMQKLFNKLA